MARVRLFANLRELAGSSSVEVEAATIGAAMEALEDRFGPEFSQQLKTARIWKNGDEGSLDDPVGDGDELAVIPPVSGGSIGYRTGRMANSESFVLAGLMLALIVAGSIGTEILVSVWVGVVAWWAIDLVHTSAGSDFRMDYQPILASILVSMAAANALGLPGMGVGVAVSVVLVMGWAVVRPSARDLTSLAATALAAITASLAVASVLLARSMVDGGDRQVAGLLIIVTVGVLVGRLVQYSRSFLIDPNFSGPVMMVVAAVAVAYLSGFELLTWFFIGIFLACATIAGSGIGLAYRNGTIRLTGPALGSLSALDGPMLAVAAFTPMLRILG